MNKFATFFLMIEVFTVCMKTNDFLFLQQVICKKKTFIMWCQMSSINNEVQIIIKSSNFAV